MKVVYRITDKHIWREETPLKNIFLSFGRGRAPLLSGNFPTHGERNL